MSVSDDLIREHLRQRRLTSDASAPPSLSALKARGAIRRARRRRWQLAVSCAVLVLGGGVGLLARASLDSPGSDATPLGSTPPTVALEGVTPAGSTVPVTKSSAERPTTTTATTSTASTSTTTVAAASLFLVAVEGDDLVLFNDQGEELDRRTLPPAEYGFARLVAGHPNAVTVVSGGAVSSYPVAPDRRILEPIAARHQQVGLLAEAGLAVGQKVIDEPLVEWRWIDHSTGATTEIGVLDWGFKLLAFDGASMLAYGPPNGHLFSISGGQVTEIGDVRFVLGDDGVVAYERDGDLVVESPQGMTRLPLDGRRAVATTGAAALLDSGRIAALVHRGEPAETVVLLSDPNRQRWDVTVPAPTAERITAVPGDRAVFSGSTGTYVLDADTTATRRVLPRRAEPVVAHR